MTMMTLSHVARSLAFWCAAQFETVAPTSSFWRAHEVMFRAGPVMPSDLFADPSLREKGHVVAFEALAGKGEMLMTPLGGGWRETLRILPVVGLTIGDGRARVRMDAVRPAPGLVSLMWRDAGGACRSVRHVADTGEEPSHIASSLASMLGAGAVSDGPDVLVPRGTLMGSCAGYGRSSRLVRRQSQVFRISVVSGDDRLCPALIDLLTSVLLPDDWVPLVDGQQAQIALRGESIQDAMQTEGLYRREIHVGMIWDQFRSVWSPQMVAGGGWLGAQGGDIGIAPVPDEMGAGVPKEALEAMATALEMPHAYRALKTDRYGTVCRADTSDPGGSGLGGIV